MNADPERLLRDAGADPTERELLASVRNVEPPDSAKARAWQGIAGHIAAGVAVGTAAAGASAATAKGAASIMTPSLAFKTLAVLVAGGVAAGGYVAWQGASAPPASSPATLAPAPAVLEPHAQTLEPKRDEATTPPPSVEQASPKRAPDPSRIDPLTVESALLAEARSRLRAGDASGAQDLLAKMQARFPRGVLRQEREVLAIEVLTARGQTEAARDRARAFVRAYPKSPHSEKLRRVLDGP
ncbi:MAG TPA: outer membrane protein assembly factor BamD [Polyangiaceae bacterium]|nr:outer membrane protein assembly factor BamD [Polyangiaceae bacterium]